MTLLSVAAVALVCLAAALPTTALAQAAPFCAPGQSAAFRFGIGALQQRLGPIMGAPLECEHVNPANGDTIQRTTTGLAYFQPSINTPMFTDGHVHYALAGDTLVLWRGEAVTLPPPDPIDAAYLAATAPYRDHLGDLLAQLADDQRLADAGQIDQVDGDALSGLLNDLWAARRVLGATPHSPKLDEYARTVDMAISQALDAGNLLFHARRSDSDTEQVTLIMNARPFTASSDRIRQDAELALSSVVPIVVNQ